MKAGDFSVRKGTNFYFDDEGKTIRVWFSAYTGQEKVFMNEVLVSKRWSYLPKSTHTFTHEESVYRITYATESVLNGPHVCTVYKNDKRYRCTKLAFYDDWRKPPFFMKFWFYVFLGLLFAVTSSFFNLPDWMFILFLVFIFLFSTVCHKRYQAGPRFVEEPLE